MSTGAPLPSNFPNNLNQLVNTNSTNPNFVWNNNSIATYASAASVKT